MPRLLTKLTVLAALAAPLIAPGVAFAQVVCSPADSSMNCPPVNDGGGSRIRRPDQGPHGPDGIRPGKGVSGNPSAHAAGGGVGGAGGGSALPGSASPSGGMGHGGTAGGAAGGAAGGGHGK